VNEEIVWLHRHASVLRGKAATWKGDPKVRESLLDAAVRLEIAARSISRSK
jgi:hypothetical protein